MVILKDETSSAKDTILDDSAAIYQKREEKSERQKLSEMKTFGEKMNYFKMYYLKTAIAAIVLLVLGIYLVYTILSPKDQFLLRVAMVDYPTDISVSTQMENEFLEAAGITLGEHEKIKFDTQSYCISGGDPNTLTSLATHIFAGELDVMIAPESLFRNYAFNGSILPLDKALPEDLYTALEKRFYFCKLSENHETYEESTSDEYALGLYLDETPFWNKYGKYFRQEERPVIGIIGNSKNMENAIRLLRYLYEIAQD